MEPLVQSIVINRPIEEVFDVDTCPVSYDSTFTFEATEQGTKMTAHIQAQHCWSSYCNVQQLSLYYLAGIVPEPEVHRVRSKLLQCINFEHVIHQLLFRRRPHRMTLLLVASVSHKQGGKAHAHAILADHYDFFESARTVSCFGHRSGLPVAR